MKRLLYQFLKRDIIQKLKWIGKGDDFINEVLIALRLPQEKSYQPPDYGPRVIATYNYKTHILTVTDTKENKVKQYHGSSTVWRSYPLMRRCSSYLERKLSDTHKYIMMHGNPYPTAHLNKQDDETNI